MNKELFPIDLLQIESELMSDTSPPCLTPNHIDKFYLYHGYRLTPV